MRIKLKLNISSTSLIYFIPATPEVTFKKLFPDCSLVRKEIFGEDFVRAVDQIDYVSPVTKINGKNWNFPFEFR